MAWNTASIAVLADGRRVLVSDTTRFDGRTVIEVDEHVWRYTREGRDAVEVLAMGGFTGFKTATTEELVDAVALMDPLSHCPARRHSTEKQTTGENGLPANDAPRSRRSAGSSTHADYRVVWWWFLLGCWWGWMHERGNQLVVAPFGEVCPATSCSPTQSPVQYHWR